MVSKGMATFFRRKDGKILLYLPKDFVQDSNFPIHLGEMKSKKVPIWFDKRGVHFMER